MPGLALKKKYKKERHSSVSSVDQKYAGGLISSSLMCIICSPWFRCKSVFHNGMTCQFYQLLQADDNHSLRVSAYPNICAPKLRLFLSDLSPIIGYACHSLTHSLTHSCLVNLTDVILSCEDAYSKLVEVVTVADVDDEDRVGNRFGHKAKLLFRL